MLMIDHAEGEVLALYEVLGRVVDVRSWGKGYCKGSTKVRYVYAGDRYFTLGGCTS